MKISRNWFNKNRIIHGLLGLNLGEVLEWSTSFVADYKVACAIENYTHQQSQGVVISWQRPIQNYYKINTDAAFDSARKAVGIEIVIRDSMGKVMVYGAHRIYATYTPQVAKVVAIYWGLLLAHLTGLTNVMPESDAAVVDWINAGKVFYSEVGVVVDDIRRLLQCFSSSPVSYVSRKANSVAHHLATLALFSDDDHVWLED
ncbi:hypothetical protein Ddye_001149 [Dipteronia dyeriana]|uniref:RNase H type-1 domain-containing protein n=1 Tax=Dipteronia dyeriana TaxID=168575 RepID=A0AAE0CT15_9ROSI|nr:hypothetical protein Ddye_001149 [Dipteronia dyeriana]